MKTNIKRILGIFLFMAIVCGNFGFAQEQGNNVRVMGPGPVVSIDATYESMPDAVKNFLNTYFPTAGTEKIKLKTMQGVYKIDLTNGFEVEITSEGQWLEIEAPGNAVIPQNIVQALLPAESYNTVEQSKAIDRVEELSFRPGRGYKVEIREIKDFYFDINGNSVKAPKGDRGKGKMKPGPKADAGVPNVN